MTEGQTTSGVEPPSTGLLFVLIVLVSGAAVLGLASLFTRLRRNRSTRRLVEALTSRLGGGTTSTDGRRTYPAARPSPFTKRFAGVRVVNANAVVDEAHYERLRDFPDALVEVSECSTNAASADFSQLEAATASVATSLRSRGGAASVRSSRFSAAAPPDGSRASGSVQLNEHDATFLPSSSPVIPVETAISSRADGINGATRPAEGAGPVPALLKGRLGGWPDSSSGVAPRGHLLTSTPQDACPPTAPGEMGRRIISNISVEDLAAHCAAQLDMDDGDSNTLLDPPLTVPTEASREAREAMEWRAQSSAGGAPGPAAAVAAMDPFTFIMRKKAQLARGARSVRIVEPSSTSASTVSERERSSTPSPQRARPVVRREHHRHHVAKGGFIVCNDFVPDLASRRARRRQVAADKKKFVFRLKDDEDYYGRAAYVEPSAAVRRGDEDDEM